MKKIIVVLLALSLLMLPLTGFAAGGGKSSMFDKDIGTSEEEVPSEEPAEVPDRPIWVPVEEPDQGDIEESIPLTESADGYSAAAICNRIVAFLDSIEWNYNLENDVITFNASIDGKLKSLSYRIVFFDNGYTTYAYPNLYADSDNMLAVAEYLHRANYGLRNGNFEIDFNDGEIRYKSYVDCSNALPGDDVITRSITVPGNMFEIYGDGLLQVSFGMLTPLDAITAAEE